MMSIFYRLEKKGVRFKLSLDESKSLCFSVNTGESWKWNFTVVLTTSDNSRKTRIVSRQRWTENETIWESSLINPFILLSSNLSRPQFQPKDSVAQARETYLELSKLTARSCWGNLHTLSLVKTVNHKRSLHLQITILWTLSLPLVGRVCRLKHLWH